MSKKLEQIAVHSLFELSHAHDTADTWKTYTPPMTPKQTPIRRKITLLAKGSSRTITACQNARTLLGR
jgi:hypothetical protein